MIRAAVIGVGNMGRHHARIYNELDDVQLVAVVDADRSRAEALARRLKVAAYSAVEEMLERERPDCVSLAVPTQYHFEVARNLIERGVHTLIEKPITATQEQAHELIALAKQRDVRLAVGHIERFNSAITELKRRLDQGDLGDIYQLNSRRISSLPRQVGDVGVVLDLATHELDIMRHLSGAPVEYLFAEVGRKVHGKHEDMLSCIMHFANGVTGVLDINWLTPTKIRELRVTGSKGAFVVDYLLQDLYFYENSFQAPQWDSIALLQGVAEGDMRKIRVDKMEPLRAELLDFTQAAQEGRSPRVTGEDGLQVLALAQTLLRSGAARQVVTL